MPMRPRSGRRQVVRQRKSCARSSVPGCLKLKTSQPCGLIPDMTCLMAPSLPAEYLDVVAEHFLAMLLGSVKRFHPRRPIFQFDLFAFADAKVFRFNFHRIELSKM